MNETLVIVLAGLLGACVGSFLNVCIYRLPQDDLSVTRPRGSFCPRCQIPIAWFDNIPLVSWLVLRGRCRRCGNRISVRYPFVELTTALLFVLVVIEVGAPPFDGVWLLTHVFWATIMAVLLVVTFIDIDHRIIPDELSVTGAALVPFCAWGIPGVPVDGELPHRLSSLLERSLVADLGWPEPLILGLAALGAAIAGMVVFRKWSPSWDGSRRTWWETRLAATTGACLGIVLGGMLFIPGWVIREPSQALLASLVGMTVGAGCIYGIGVLGKVMFRKDAMGFGDVKLMALLGGVLGWQEVLLAVFLACMLGSVIGVIIKFVTRSSYIPFGPFLSGGAVILVLWGDWVALGWDWYQSLFRVK